MMDLRVVMALSVGGGGGDDVYGLSSRAVSAARFLAVTRSVERGSLLSEGLRARRAASTAASQVSCGNALALTALVRTSKRRYAQKARRRLCRGPRVSLQLLRNGGVS